MKAKFIGISVASEGICYIFANQYKEVKLFKIIYYVLDIGIGLKAGRCSLASN